jgi:aspartyl-tRNA synthetase
MCEFMGLDFEMEIKEHYTEITDVLGDLMCYIFDQLNKNCAKELEAVRKQYPFENLTYLKDTLRISFVEACKMLNDAGVKADPHEDLSTPQEKFLGGLIKKKYNTDFYIIDKYPKEARPFYTMPCPENPVSELFHCTS